MLYLGWNLRPENDIARSLLSLLCTLKKINHNSSDVLVVCLCIQSLWQEDMLL